MTSELTHIPEDADELMPPSATPLAPDRLLCELVKALVDKPASVRVEVTQAEGGAAMFIIHAAAEDRGKVIGKQGVTITSLRTLFARIAAVASSRVFIELADSKAQGTQ